MWYNGAGGDFLTHLLVVDDEVSILELIKNSLGKDGYLITVCQNRRTYNRNHAVHIEQNAMFTLLIFCFPAANHRYHSYPTSFFSNHLAVKNDSAANQASEMTNTSIIIQNAIAVL